MIKSLLTNKLVWVFVLLFTTTITSYASTLRMQEASVAINNRWENICIAGIKKICEGKGACDYKFTKENCSNNNNAVNKQLKVIYACGSGKRERLIIKYNEMKTISCPWQS